MDDLYNRESELNSYTEHLRVVRSTRCFYSLMSWKDFFFPFILIAVEECLCFRLWGQERSCFEMNWHGLMERILEVETIYVEVVQPSERNVGFRDLVGRAESPSISPTYNMCIGSRVLSAKRKSLSLSARYGASLFRISSGAKLSLPFLEFPSVLTILPSSHTFVRVW